VRGSTFLVCARARVCMCIWGFCGFSLGRFRHQAPRRARFFCRGRWRSPAPRWLLKFTQHVPGENEETPKKSERTSETCFYALPPRCPLASADDGRTKPAHLWRAKKKAVTATTDAKRQTTSNRGPRKSVRTTNNPGEAKWTQCLIASTNITYTSIVHLLKSCELITYGPLPTGMWTKQTHKKLHQIGRAWQSETVHTLTPLIRPVPREGYGAAKYINSTGPSSTPRATSRPNLPQRANDMGGSPSRSRNKSKRVFPRSGTPTNGTPTNGTPWPCSSVDPHPSPVSSSAIVPDWQGFRSDGSPLRLPTRGRRHRRRWRPRSGPTGR